MVDLIRMNHLLKESNSNKQQCVQSSRNVGNMIEMYGDEQKCVRRRIWTRNVMVNTNVDMDMICFDAS